MKKILSTDETMMSTNNLKKISTYTYENVIESHINAITEICKAR